MPKRSSHIRIVIPDATEDRAITAAAKSAPDAQPLTARQLQAMVPMRSLRGRPPSVQRKQLVSIRYSPEVLAFFRASGQGWQARMDQVLREYVANQPPRAKRD